MGLVHYQAMSWFNNHKDKRKLAGQKGSSDVKKLNIFVHSDGPTNLPTQTQGHNPKDPRQYHFNTSKFKINK